MKNLLLIGVFLMLGLLRVDASSLPPVPYGVPNGVATLNSSGILNTAQTPSYLVTVEKRYAPDTGLLAQYLMYENSGTTLDDTNPNAPGANTVSFSGLSSQPSWGNGGLNWTGGTTNAIPLPAAVGSGVQWIHLGIVNAVAYGNGSGSTAATPVYNTPVAYGASGVSGQALEFTQGYDCESLAGVGYGTTFLSYAQNTPGNCVGTFAQIDENFHVLDIVFNQSALTYTVYLDGVLELKTASAITVAAMASGGTTYLGGAPYTGNTACAVATCGYGGEITEAEFSTTIPTQAQITQDYNASVDLANYKGVSSTPYYPTYQSPLVLNCIGESQTWGNGLSTPSTQSYCAQVAGLLQTDYGLTTTFIKDGVNNNSGYTMNGNVQGSVCTRKINALAFAGSKVLVVLWDNSNAERHYLGYLSGGASWPSPYNTSVSAEALADIAAETQCSLAAQRLGYFTMIGNYPSNYASVNADTNIKDVVNPLIRRLAANNFNVVFTCSDARYCADGAANTNQTGTACYGNPCYQSGGVHMTYYGYEVVANDMVNSWAMVLNVADQETISATTYSMAPPDIGRTIYLTGTSTNFTLNPCAGLYPNTKEVVLDDTGSASDTVTAGTEYGGGTQDLINGATTYTLPLNTLTKFTVKWNGDVAGTCGLTAAPGS